MHLDEFRRSYEGFVKLMCRIDSVPLPQHAEMRIAGRLLDTWQKVISDRIVELHFERSTDFGQDVECYAENSAGADSTRERIPCKFHFQRKKNPVLKSVFHSKTFEISKKKKFKLKK